jgi:hypothetical protein
MKTTSLSADGAPGDLLGQIRALLPAAKGSVSEVRKPCIRPHCRACKEGRKHPCFILQWNDGKRRRCTYVPASLVADLRKAIANGRGIERLLSQAGARMVMEARRRR